MLTLPLRASSALQPREAGQAQIHAVTASSTLHAREERNVEISHDSPSAWTYRTDQPELTVSMSDQDEYDHTTLRFAAAQAARALNDAPPLVAHIRSLVTPSLSRPSDGMPRSASKEPPAPLRLEPIDDVDAVFAQLVDWVTYWAGALDRPQPASTRAGRVNEAGETQGLRGNTTPENAEALTRILVNQLVTWEPEIYRHPAARDYYEDVTNIARRASNRYPQAPRAQRPVSPRKCSVCDEHAVGAEWASEDVRDVIVSCTNCGNVTPFDARILEWLD
jgi:hypothetical protein